MKSRSPKIHASHIAALLVLAVIAILVFCGYRTPAAEQIRSLSPSIATSTASRTSLVPQKHAPPDIVYGDRSRKIAIFTFDAGDTTQSAEGILAALAKHHVKGTFFMTGKFIEANPDLVHRVVAAGHEIFNHTYDHKDLTKIPDSAVIAELNGMDAVLSSTTGLSTKPYFRAPYGARDDRVRAAASADGYRSVYWTIDARDWMESRGETADQVRQRILSKAVPGAIILMHLGDTLTAAVLDDVMTTLEGQGYTMVSLTQGLPQ